jgi:glycosyltransferase involved in cell wall biosynthesis
MKVAVVTPYHRESIALLEQCYRSVAAQYYPCRHVMVADGFPNPAVDGWPVLHLKLPAAHGDGGSAGRYAGAVAAIEAGAEAIAFLDADNWLQPDHIATLVVLALHENADLATAGRSLHRLDGSLLGIDEQKTGFVDTSCMLLRQPIFPLIEVWNAIPVSLWGICDRIFSMALRERAARRVHSRRPTVCYRTGFAIHYRQCGEAPPFSLGEKEAPLRRGAALWDSLPIAGRRRIVYAGDPSRDLPPPWPEDRPEAPPAYRLNFNWVK